MLNSEQWIDIDDSDTTSSFSPRNKLTGEWKGQESITEVKRYDDFVTIDWVEDSLDNHRHIILNAEGENGLRLSLKGILKSYGLSWIMLSLMGVFIGTIAGCLNIITAWLASIREGHCSGNFHLSKNLCCYVEGGDCSNWRTWTSHSLSNYIIYLGVSVLFSYGSAMLVKVFAPSAAGSGISEIKCIVSGFSMKGFLGWSTLCIKSLGLPLAIASGLSLGKEGPSVHYAVCVGNCIAKLITRYRKSASKARDFLTATSAAGVAVAFGSPMGGVLFSIEEISSVFQLSTVWKSYFCSLIAVTTLAAINPFRSGQLVMFEVSYNTNWHYFEIPFYIILGAFGGVYGIIVSKLNIRVVSFRRRYLSSFAVREVLILASFTASFSYFNQFLRLDMTEAMEVLFSECGDEQDHWICKPSSNKGLIFFSLVFATVARMCLTIVTYGCKVPAGIFVPSMAAGATFGRALGIVVEALNRKLGNKMIFASCTETEKCIIPGTYAFLGAAAALSGITHLTVTVVVIMFELTGALRYIIPSMIVVAITKSINDKWGKGGIADQMIYFNGLPLIDSKEHPTFNTSVRSAMTPAVVSLPDFSSERLTLKKLRQILTTCNYRGFPVVKSTSDPRIIGFIQRTELELSLRDFTDYDENTICTFNEVYSDNSVNMRKILNKSPPIVDYITSLEYVWVVFSKLGPRCILVEKEGKLIGLITRKDILRYEHSLHAHGRDENANLGFERLEEMIWTKMTTMTDTIVHSIWRLAGGFGTRYQRI